ncbi:MAG TPA: hypothetical protein VHN79_00215 [Lacunisphaera sp.]|nr:hypothetical protein [Lacunisphaera sp.]
MKRLVWLFVAILATALVQVAPATAASIEACGCCEDSAPVCAHDEATAKDNCVACPTCVSGPCSLLPEVAVLAQVNPREISRLDASDLSGGELAYRPLLPPPRGTA